MKRNLHNILACTLLAALPSAVLAQTASGAKKLYCWNENGIQVCGDTLPPSAVDRARTEISPRSGLRTGEVPRALTPDERAMEAEAAQAAARAADVEAAARRRDLAMVESYVTEADLRRAYGERITLVDESMKTSRLSIASLRQSLLSLLRQAAEIELHSRPVGQPLAASILGQHSDLLRMQAMLDGQLRERATLDEELAQAVERYRQMTAQPTQG
ncbi:MAG: hypothetical protein M3485_01445 [Pseudomonadota bacterium]|nr:hypothetical protein [Pseudomonadota bacterium]